jgi:hypothetical protein
MILKITLTALLLTGLCGFSGESEVVFYENDFNAPMGTTYPEWTSTGYTNTANRAGTVAAGRGPQAVSVTESPNGRQRFLGEFGGPVILKERPYDPDHFVTVDETVRLTLHHLPRHKMVTVSVDLLILKSWDGNNPNYGPDRWRLSIPRGAVLLAATFSNNFKTGAYDLSLQDYPTPGSAPQAGSLAHNTLGYRFFGDAIYRVTRTFEHDTGDLLLEFSSSLYEGKGTEDESWGLDNVRITLGM